MADEIDQEELVTDEPIEQEEVALTPIEEYAKSKGWKPQAEWKGEGEWRDATAFLDYSFDRSRDLKRDLNTVRDSVDRLTRTQEQERTRAAEQARAAERQRWEQMLNVAVDEGDNAKAFEASQKIAEIAAEPIQTVRGPDPMVTKFIADNSWFDSDPIARAVATTESGRIAAAGGSVEDQLRAALAAVHKRFPEYAPVQAKTIDVAAPASRLPQRGNREKGVADLSADQLAAARWLVSQGRIKSIDAYAKQAFNTEGTIE